MNTLPKESRVASFFEKYFSHLVIGGIVPILCAFIGIIPSFRKGEPEKPLIISAVSSASNLSAQLPKNKNPRRLLALENQPPQVEKRPKSKIRAIPLLLSIVVICVLGCLLAIRKPKNKKRNQQRPQNKNFELREDTKLLPEEYHYDISSR